MTDTTPRRYPFLDYDDGCWYLHLDNRQNTYVTIADLRHLRACIDEVLQSEGKAKKTIKVSVTLPAELGAKLEAMALARGVTVTELLRKARYPLAPRRDRW